MNSSFRQGADDRAVPRMTGKKRNDRRHREINEKVPQIAEINSQMAQTSARLFGLMQAGKAD